MSAFDKESLAFTEVNNLTPGKLIYKNTLEKNETINHIFYELKLKK